MRTSTGFISLLVFLSSISANGLSVNPNIIYKSVDNSIGIFLNNDDSVRLGTATPTVMIGNSVGRCFVPGLGSWRTWTCEIPKTAAVGRQRLLLMKNDSQISSVDINIVDSDGSQMTLSKPNYKWGEYRYLYLDEWINNLLDNNFNRNLIKNINDYRTTNGDAQADLLYWRKKTYTPESVRLFKDSFASSRPDIENPNDLPQEVNIDGGKTSVPEECLSSITEINPNEKLGWSWSWLYNTSVRSSEALASVAPTRDPDVGNGDQSDKTQILPRLVGASYARKFNSNVKSVIGKNMPSYNRSNNVIVYILDTFNSLKNEDVYKKITKINGKYVEVKDHGKVIYNIIKFTSGLQQSSIVGVQVCDTVDGVCGIPKIIGALCKAAFEASVNQKRVIVNMSFATTSSGNHIGKVVDFALRTGVYIIAANGNLDKCRFLKPGEICHQYPADWSNGLDDVVKNPLLNAGRLLSVGALDINSSRRIYRISPYDRFSTGQGNSEYRPTLYAPGGFYYPYSNGQYIYRFGTSFATAYASGVLAAWLGTPAAIAGGKFPCSIDKYVDSIKTRILWYPDSKSHC